MSIVKWLFGSPKYQIVGRLFGNPWSERLFDTRTDAVMFLRESEAYKRGYVWIGECGLEIRKVWPQ
jgi:hypothetical protein